MSEWKEKRLKRNIFNKYDEERAGTRKMKKENTPKFRHTHGIDGTPHETPADLSVRYFGRKRRK